MKKKFKEMVAKIGTLPVSILAAPSEPTYSQCKLICVKNTQEKGRGVFAKEDIEAGELIEEAPVLIFQGEALNHYPLNNYYFRWHNSIGSATCGALALGYGSIYNHSYEPNAKYEQIYDQKIIRFIAIKDIDVGDEITVNYNKDPKDNSALWFEVK